MHFWAIMRDLVAVAVTTRHDDYLVHCTCTLELCAADCNLHQAPNKGSVNTPNDCNRRVKTRNVAQVHACKSVCTCLVLEHYSIHYLYYVILEQ